MRLGAVPLLAVIPLCTARAPLPRSIAIEMDLRAPLGAGIIEWHAIVGDAERVRAPYDVTFCWAADGDPCTVEVRLRLFVGPQAVMDRTASGVGLPASATASASASATSGPAVAYGPGASTRSVTTRAAACGLRSASR